MDNYFTEKIAPKNNTENTQPEQNVQKPQEHRQDKPRADRQERKNKNNNRRPDAPKPVENGAEVEIIGIRFKDVGKVYYFSPNKVQFKAGEKAIVETARGIECGEIVLSNRMVPESNIVSPLKSIIRKATQADEKQLEENLKKEKEIMQVFSDKIAQHNLDMKPIDIDCKRSRSNLPHKDRASPDRRARRGEDARRTRNLRQTVLLLQLPWRVPARIYQDGKGTVALPQSHQDIGNLRQTYVLPKIRTELLRGFPAYNA